MWEKIKAKLASPVDGSSLALFRIAFGLAVFYDAWKFAMPGSEEFRLSYVLPEYNFAYAGWEWVVPLPLPWLKAVFVLLAASSLSMALGVFHRVATVLVFLCYTYTFLLESSLFNNHYYLISLFSFLLIWMPADRRFSLQAFRSKPASKEVPYWTVFLLRYQLLVVYVYGAIAKFNADFLSGEAIIGSAQVFKDQVTSVLPALEFIQVIHIAASMAWIGLFFDMFIGFILWNRRTQWIGLLLLAAFHGINQMTLPIGVFPFMGFTSSLIFLAPDWPLAVWRWFCAKLGRARPSEPKGHRKPAGKAVLSKAALGLVVAWVLFQLLFPLRHFTIKGDPSWTEEGQNFAWRMMLRQKLGGTLVLHLKDEGMLRYEAGERRVDWSKAPSDLACKGVFVGVDSSLMSWRSSLGINTLYENVTGFRIVQVMKALSDEEAREEIAELQQWWSSHTDAPGVFKEALPLEECLQNAIARLAEIGTPDAEKVAGLVQTALHRVKNHPGPDPSEVRKNIVALNDLLYMCLQTKFAKVLRQEFSLIKPFELLGMRTDQRFLVLAESPDAEGIQRISEELDRGDHYLIWCDFEKLRLHAWRQLPQWFVIYESGQLMVLWNYHPDLNRRQIENFIIKPYMIHQYVQRVAAYWERETGRRPRVNGHGSVMMNYREPQALFLPSVDLASVPYRLWTHNSWILPLDSPRIGIADRINEAEQRAKRAADQKSGK